MMQKLKPKHYVKVFYKKRKGFAFKQPIERINCKSYYDYAEDSYVRLNWGKLAIESRIYNNTLSYSLYHSDFWKNNKAKNKAFAFIYNYVKNKPAHSGSITPLFPFEIYLMNDGFEMIYFDALNSMTPGGRIYQNKQDVKIRVGFGFADVNFYFTTSNSKNNYFQLDNSFSNYQDAINGKLKSIIYNEYKL